MRKNYLLLLAIGFVTVASAQIYNDGAVIHIESGAVVYSEGDVTVANSGTVTNLGLLTTLGNYANDATTNGGGQYEVFGHWTNTNTFTHDNSRVSFLGDTDSDVTSGSDDFFEVYVGKDAGINVNLLDNAKVDGDLKFDNDNNKVII